MLFIIFRKTVAFVSCYCLLTLQLAEVNFFREYFSIGTAFAETSSDGSGPTTEQKQRIGVPGAGEMSQAELQELLNSRGIDPGDQQAAEGGSAPNPNFECPAKDSEGKPIGYSKEEIDKRISDQRLQTNGTINDAIILYNKALEESGLEKMALKIKNIEEQTQNLTGGISDTQAATSNADNVSGGVADSQSGVENQNAQTQASFEIKEKAKRKLAASAKKVYDDCVSNSSTFSSPRNGVCRAEYNDWQNKKRAADQFADIRNSGDRQIANSQNQSDNMQSSTARPMADSQQATSDAVDQVNQMNGEALRLIDETEKLLENQNNGAERAVYYAGLAKQMAVKAIGDYRNINGGYDTGKAMTLIALVDGDVGRTPSDLGNMEQIGLTTAGGFEVQCKDVSTSDGRCVSYHLYVAASAIYLANMIRETAEFNKNMQGYMCLEKGTDKNDQVWNLERAAGLSNEASKLARLRLASREHLVEMYDAVHAMSELELDAKTKRLAAAREQLAAAQADKAQAQEAQASKQQLASTMRMIAMLILALGIMKIGIGTILKALGISLACCVATQPESVTVMTEAEMKIALGEADKIKAGKIMIIVGALLMLVTFFMGEEDKADDNIDRANQEIARAEVHTHMNCVNEFLVDSPGLSTAPAPLPAFRERGTPNQVNLQAYYKENKIKRGFKYALITFLEYIIPAAYANITTLTELQQALGLKEGVATEKFYLSVKKTAAKAAIKEIPTPESRVPYFASLIAQANGMVNQMAHGAGGIKAADANQEDMNTLLNQAYNKYSDKEKSGGKGKTDAAETKNIPGMKDGPKIKNSKSGTLAFKSTNLSISSGKGTDASVQSKSGGAVGIISNSGNTSQDFKRANSDKQGDLSALRKTLNKVRKDAAAKGIKLSTDDQINAVGKKELEKFRNKALSNYKSGSFKNLDGSSGFGIMASLNKRGNKSFLQKKFKPRNKRKSFEVPSFGFGKQPKSSDISAEDALDGAPVIKESNNAELAYLDRLKSRNRAISKDRGDEINLDRDGSLFRIITKRYKKTAMPIFFKRK